MSNFYIIKDNLDTTSKKRNLVTKHHGSNYSRGDPKVPTSTYTPGRTFFPALIRRAINVPDKLFTIRTVNIRLAVKRSR